jgi:hypothetical protein
MVLVAVLGLAYIRVPEIHATSEYFHRDTNVIPTPHVLFKECSVSYAVYRLLTIKVGNRICAPLMKRTRLKKVAQRRAADDLAFVPPFSDQAKYLFLADKFLSTNGSRDKIVSIDSSKHFQRGKKAKKAA